MGTDKRLMDWVLDADVDTFSEAAWEYERRAAALRAAAVEIEDGIPDRFRRPPAYTDQDVDRYARYITGHLDAEPEAQHLAAARAVLDGLDRNRRLRSATEPPFEYASLKVVDGAARARELFGAEAAAFIAGRPLPEHDYQFEAVTPTGGTVSFNVGATAEDVAMYLKAKEAENA